MTDPEQIPQPLKGVLETHFNVNSFLFEDFINDSRDGVNPDYYEPINKQLKDAAIIHIVSNTKNFERLTGVGFEKRQSVIIWLERIRRYMFEKGPYPTMDDLD